MCLRQAYPPLPFSMVRVSRRGAWPSPALPPSPLLLSASLSVGDHEPALGCLCHAVALCAVGLAFARMASACLPRHPRLCCFSHPRLPPSAERFPVGGWYAFRAACVLRRRAAQWASRMMASTCFVYSSLSCADAAYAREAEGASHTRVTARAGTTCVQLR